MGEIQEKAVRDLLILAKLTANLLIMTEKTYFFDRDGNPLADTEEYNALENFIREADREWE